MRYKVRFYNIINYFLLGGAFIVQLFLLVTFVLGNNLASFLVFSNTEMLSTKIFTLGFVIAIAYFLGIFINAFIDVCIDEEYSKNYRKKIENIIQNWNVPILKKIYLFINRDRNILSFSMQIIKRGSIESKCKDIKLNDSKNLIGSISRWFFFLPNPHKIISIISEKISRDKDFDDLYKYKYLNKFFLGIELISILFIILNFIFTVYFFMLIFLCEPFAVGKTFIFLFLSITNMYVFKLSDRSAQTYAAKYINYIFECVDARDIEIKSSMFKNIPEAYILFRVSAKDSFENLSRSLESIITQDYPNIKIILYLYGDKETKDFYLLQEKVDNFVKDKISNNENLNYIFFAGEESNQGIALYKIKQRFVDISDEQSVAISLDATEELFSKHTISDIMLKFTLTDSKVCLLNFTETHSIKGSLVSDDKNIYNVFLQKHNITKDKSKNYDEFLRDFLCCAMTMSCTKAYKKSAAKDYLDKLNNLKFNSTSYPHKSLEGMIDNVGIFIDFLDFFILYSSKDFITTMPEISHKYMQHPSRFAEKENKDKSEIFVPRINALLFLIMLYENNKSINTSNNKDKDTLNSDLFLNFIKFKLYVIATAMKKFEHTPEDFIEEFVSDFKKCFQESDFSTKLGLVSYGDLSAFFNGMKE